MDGLIEAGIVDDWDEVRHLLESPPSGSALADLRARMNHGEPVPLDSIRRALRHHYEPQLMDHLMSAPTRRESLHRLLEVTAPMNSNDQGRIAELWYRRQFRLDPDTAVQVRIRVQGRERRFDFVESSGRSVEVKSGANALTPSDVSQLEDMMEAVSNRQRVTAGGWEVRLTQHRVVLLDPRAAERSWSTMENALRKYGSDIEFVLAGPDRRLYLFGASERRHVARHGSFDAWLEAGAPGARHP